MVPTLGNCTRNLQLTLFSLDSTHLEVLNKWRMQVITEQGFNLWEQKIVTRTQINEFTCRRGLEYTDCITL